MASEHSGTSHEKDQKSRQRQHGTHQDQKGDGKRDGSSGGKDNAGNFANDPDRARKTGQKGGQ